MSSDEEIVAALQEVYGEVDNMDAWVGSLAEDHLPGTNFGRLTSAITLNQFTRLRDGDRLFYLANEAELYEDKVLRPEIEAIVDLDSISLSDVIRANTSIAELQDDIFLRRRFPNLWSAISMGIVRLMPVTLT